MEPDLIDAVAAWQGGDVPPERCAALLARLGEDAEFRTALTGEIWMLSVLRVAQAPVPRWLELQERLGFAAKSEAEAQRALESGVMAAVLRRPLQLVHSWWRVAALAAVVIGAILGVLLWQGHSRETPTRLPVARIVQSESATWSPELKPRAGSLLAAGRLQLRSGRVTLLLAKGVVLTVQGPADLELTSTNRVVCHLGALRAHVPQGAEGFCIETPQGSATDLGTEMGVVVAPDGLTRIGVFQGAVLASLKLPGQDGVRTQTLRSGEAVKMIPGTGEFQPTNLRGFPAASEVPLPPLPFETRYAEAVRAAQPLHYWRLDRANGTSIPNEVPGGMALRMVGATRLEPDASGRVSARLGPSADGSGFEAEERWSVPRAGNAVEMWFATASCGHTTLMASTPEAKSGKHFSLLELASEFPNFVVPANHAKAGSPSSWNDSQLAMVSLRYLIRWPATNDSATGVNLVTAPTATPFAWHHVVAQRREREMEVYLDGRLLASGRSDELPPSIPVTLLFGFAYSGWNLAVPAEPNRQLHGRLAEIALYERMLSEEEIREHAALGRRKQR